MKIKDVKIGNSFIYEGHNYTKLNEDNLCIIDDYDDGFMDCIFDPIDNNFNESLIRLYINSAKFINKLNVDLHDILFVDENYLTLLSKEEYDEYKEIIKNYKIFWWLRSGDYYPSNYACYINSSGYLYYYAVGNSCSVRPALKLKPDVIVKGENNEI